MPPGSGLPGLSLKALPARNVFWGSSGAIQSGWSICRQALIYPSFGDIGGPEPFVDSAPANGAYDVGETFTDVNGNGVWDPDMGAAGAGGPGDVVVYRLSYDWSLLTPVLAGVIGEAGRVRLAASVVVRNEPYEAAGGGALP